MKALARTVLLVLAVWLQLSGISCAKQVYMKDGGILECESFWRRNGWVVVKVNRDIVLDFTPAEIDLKKTFRKPTGPRQRIETKKNLTAASATPMKEAAEAAKPAELATVKSKEGKLDPAAPAAPPTPASAKAAPAAAQPNPAPAPTSAATPTPAQAAAPPEQPEQAAPAMTKEEYEKRSRENAALVAQAVKENNPELMKKALAAQQALIKEKNAANGSGKAAQKGEPVWFKYFLMFLASCLFVIIAMWAIFRKAGESGWKSLVPIYNMYILMRISGKPGWWSFLLLIPVAGIAVYLLAMLSLAEKFGRSAAYGMGLFLLPMFFFPMLAFGGAKYQEAMPLELEFTFAEEPIN